MVSDVGIGDVIRAWRALGAHDDRERRAIARLLGFDLREHEAAPPPPPIDPPGPAEPAEPATLTTATAVEPPVPVADAPGQPIELVRYPDVRDNEPALHAAIGRPVALPEPLLESLFAAGWSRAIASTLTARSAAVGAIDIERTIALIALRRSVTVLPRRKRLVSATEVIVVIDARGTLAWFDRDAAELVARLDAVTRAQVGVVLGEGAPVLAIATGSAGAAELLDDDQPPPASIRVGAGGRVIGITDLGLGSSWVAGDPGRAAAWIELALALRSHGASLAIVTPTPIERVPARLVRLAACVSWDGATRPGSVHRLIKGRT